MGIERAGGARPGGRWEHRAQRGQGAHLRASAGVPAAPPPPQADPLGAGDALGQHPKCAGERGPARLQAPHRVPLWVRISAKQDRYQNLKTTGSLVCGKRAVGDPGVSLEAGRK